MTFRITFLPDRLSVDLDEPLELSLAAALADIWCEQPCGAKGICGKCRVRVVEGDAPITPADRRALTEIELADRWRLGCQLTLAAPATVEVPAKERAVALKSFGPPAPIDGLEPQEPHGLVREGVTPWGVAVDLGSTTLAAALVKLDDGRVVATASCLNPQVRFGADIMSRIHFAQRRPDGNAQLHEILISAVGGLIDELLSASRVAGDRVVALTCVGNATMTHAAAGADVTPLGEAPYVGSFVDEQEVSAQAFGWAVHPRAAVRLAPMIGSHLGGDTVAGILACGLDQEGGWRLLVDLGTNAEVVLSNGERIVATSTAAGPAFDGAILTCGMRAVAGAIDGVHVRPDGHVTVSTIGGRPPAGLCGSGLVDAVAGLLQAGVVAPSGYMRGEREYEAAGVPSGLRERLVGLPGEDRAVRLAGDVVVSARDVRQLQLAKGAIAAGTALLMARLGVTNDDLREVLVAGTFGTFLRKPSLVAIGMLPRVDPQRIRFVGNAAGAGARLMLADRRSRRRANDIARRSEWVELAGDPSYQDAFCAAVPFPALAEEA